MTVEPASKVEEAHEVKDQTAGSANEVENLLLRHVMMAAGAGLLPVPLLDIAAVTGINLKMLRDLSALYKVEFRGELARSAVASLLTSVGGEMLVMGPVSSLLKAIPGVGSVVGGLAGPGVMGGLTYATGRVFQHHFESGGTFLDFDASRFTSIFKREAAEGAKRASEAQETTVEEVTDPAARA